MLLLLKWWIITLLCWPLLLWQGKRVQKQVLRLPEAAGRRSGMLGSGEPVRLLICGDSAAAGVGIAEQQQAFAGQLVGLLAKQHQVNWLLAAKSGVDSAGLNALLQQLYDHHNAVYRLDIVVVSIGVNDVTALNSKTAFRKQINALLGRFATDFTDPYVVFNAIPPMQHFSALSSPLNVWLGLKAALLNKVLADEIEKWPKAKIIYTEQPLTDNMLAADGFHPSEAGSIVWANQVFQAVTHRLTEIR